MDGVVGRVLKGICLKLAGFATVRCGCGDGCVGVCGCAERFCVGSGVGACVGRLWGCYVRELASYMCGAFVCGGLLRVCIDQLRVWTSYICVHQLCVEWPYVEMLASL